MRLLSHAWTTGILLRRYKRFLADVMLEDESVVTVHCPNTGAMTNCFGAGDRVYLSRAKDPKRKTPFTWEVNRHGRHWIGINAAKANGIIGEALYRRALPGFESVQSVLPEQSFAGSRIDFRLTFLDRPDMLLEVKSVTYRAANNVGLFPDAPSERALKHLEALIEARRQGLQAGLMFCAQHTGIDRIAPATDIAIYAIQNFVKTKSLSPGICIFFRTNSNKKLQRKKISPRPMGPSPTLLRLRKP